MSASYSATASLKAVREAQVVSMTSGVLLKLMAEEGDPVKAGDVLARLDPDRKGMALAQAEAQLRSDEHTSELLSLMRTSYAVFCLKQNNMTTYFMTEHAPYLSA